MRPAGAERPLRSRPLAAQRAANLALLEVPRGRSVGAPPTLASSVGGGLIGQAAVLLGYPSARQANDTLAQAHATALAAVTIANEHLLDAVPAPMITAFLDGNTGDR